MYVQNARVPQTTYNLGLQNFVNATLSYSASAKKQFLGGCFYYPSENGNFNSIEESETIEEIFVYTAGSRTCHMILPFFSPLEQLGKLIPNKTSININLYPNNSSFLLLTPNTSPPSYAIKINSARLNIARVTLFESRRLAIESELATQGAIYDLNKFQEQVLLNIPAKQSRVDRLISNNSIPDR